MWPDHFFRYYFVVTEKRKAWSGHARLCAREKSCSMCELARALVNRSQSMKIATFSTRDLLEQPHKSYVACYQANKELVSR